MAKYVMRGMYKGGDLHIEAEFEKPDIGAFRKLVGEAKAIFGGGYRPGNPDELQAIPSASPEPEETPPPEEPEDDGLGLDDDPPVAEEEELPFSREDVASAAKEAIAGSDEDTDGARGKVAAIFMKYGKTKKLADIKESVYGKIIRALKAGI